jgi:MFS family permease
MFRRLKISNSKSFTIMKTLQTRLHINRWLLIGARAFAAGFAAGTPGITALWADRGLQRGDFYLLEILFAAALVVLEIATGRFADRFGKVLTLKLGFIVLIFSAAQYSVASGFGGFLVGEVLAALGIALISGTDEALLFQSNRALGRDDEHQRWWSWSLGCSFVAMAVFAVIGAHLSAGDLSAPFRFCLGCQVLGLLACFAMVEPAVSSDTVSAKPGGTFREAISAVLLSSSHIRWMAIVPGFVAGINQTFLWMYPEYLADCNIDRSESGWVFALFNLVAGSTAMGLREIRDPKRAVQILFVLMLALAGSTIGLASMVGGLAWLLIIPQQMVRSISGALFSHSINAAIPDAVRATALSVRNAVRVLIYVAVMVPWWLGIDHLGRTGMFNLNLLMLVIGGVIAWATSPRGLRQ